jgi:ssDNA-binding Zn-finger/Zn-ribbon topoisomerase 1
LQEYYAAPKFAARIFAGKISVPKKSENQSRSPQAEWNRRQYAAGKCPGCGDLCDVNLRTRKLFYYCPKCRAKIAPKKAALMRKRRAMKKENGIAEGFMDNI